MSRRRGRRPGIAASRGWACVVVALLAAGAPAPAVAQDLEPKAYSASPVGAAFLILGLSRSTGAVVVDATLPISDVEAKANAVLLGGGYTFGLFGKMALVSGAVPYSWADVTGQVGEEARAVSRSGLADARLKLSVNLVGNPAMGARAFVKAPRKAIVGTSLTVAAPSGEYDGTKLINLGTNRWAFKPELGISIPKGRWDFDAYVGVWLFAQNGNFFPGGQPRSQDPVTTIQGHASYTLRPRFWVALDLTRYDGGAATVGEGEPTLPMGNSRAGVTVSVPMGRTQSLKLAYSSGVAVRTGTDFRTLSVGWQWLRLTKP